MLQAKLHFNLATGLTELWVFDERGDGSRSVAKPVELYLQSVEYGQAASPTLALPDRAARPLLESLADELNTFGIRPPDQSRLEGELAAAREHLGDVRKWFDFTLQKTIGNL